MPVRCLGCRYCMAACPYHARYFNWWDPDWPGELGETLNPDVSTRTRGVVEKCNFCSHRLQAAQDAQAAAGGDARPPSEYTPACVEACPAGAIVFGDLNDPQGEVARLAAGPDCFRLLERLGTGPKVYYRTRASLGAAPRRWPPGGGRREEPWMNDSCRAGSRARPLGRFLLWLAPWVALLAVGLYAAYLCLALGLNQTNMDNRFAFGLWIYLDLTVIALGAGAFFTGFLLYILKKQRARRR